MVDLKHKGKYITYEKRYECFDKLHVYKGKLIRKGQILSTSNAGTIKKFDVSCDKAKVKRITKSTTNVGGTVTEVFNVIVEYKRNLRDGVNASDRVEVDRVVGSLLSKHNITTDDLEYIGDTMVDYISDTAKLFNFNIIKKQHKLFGSTIAVKNWN